MAQYNPLQAAQLGPDVLARQLQLQRSQQFAQDAAQSEAPQGQMVSGHYVAPSITQHLAQGLKGYLGAKATRELPNQIMGLQQAQQESVRNMFGLGQASPQALAQGLSGGQQGGSMLPSIPGMSREQQALIASQIGLPEYLKLAANKGGPVNVAPGGSLYNPQTGQVDYTAPKDGIAIQNGQATPVQGYADIAARNAGMETAAQEGAKAQFDLVQVPDGNGGMVTMPRAQAVQALGGQPGQQGQPSGALGETLPKQVLEAREDLPKVVNQADQMISSIDGLLNHPGLDSSVGLKSYLPVIRGTDRADFQTRSEQLQGQAFLQAFNDLKGGGQITEVEGAKATAAIGRMSNAQSKEAYTESLAELRDILQTAKSRAYEKAGLPMPEAQSEQPEQPSQQAGIAAPTDAASYSALPSGTVFRAPDGSIRRKP